MPRRKGDKNKHFEVPIREISDTDDVISPDEVIENATGYQKTIKPLTKMLSAKEKQRKALALRLQGLTYERIAELMGWARGSSAIVAVKQALEEWNLEELQELRMITYARLEMIIQINWPAVLQRDPQATAIVFSAMDRIERLYGFGGNIELPTSSQTGQGEGVLTIGGDKDQYIDGLKKARKQLKSG